jgi:predicted NBD/HSP70 family sugar kinase
VSAAATNTVRAQAAIPATLDDVVELAVAGDPGAVRVVQDAGRAVGQALAGVFAVLDPGLVVVGGKTSAAGDPLLAGLREELLRRLPPALADGVRVVRGTLGARAEVLGAIALAGRHAALPLIPQV